MFMQLSDRLGSRVFDRVSNANQTELATSVASTYNRRTALLIIRGFTPAAPSANYLIDILADVIARKAAIAGASRWMINLSRDSGARVLSNAQKARIIVSATRKIVR